jgi:hypothetical protein
MLKPDEEQFFINSPVFGTRINSSNRTAVSKLQKHPQFGTDRDKDTVSA